MTPLMNGLAISSMVINGMAIILGVTIIQAQNTLGEKVRLWRWLMIISNVACLIWVAYMWKARL